jgi:hypothetical protein
MDYHGIYKRLVERARTRSLDGYHEIHHIIPRCMGGSDEPENLVTLTPEEHYLAHQLLIKMYPGNRSLIKAAIMMIPRRPGNKLYGWLRRKFSDAMSEDSKGSKNSQYGTKWITNGIIERKIKRVDPIPEGWYPTRLSAYLKKLERQKKLESNTVERSKRKELYVQQLHNLHQIYKDEGFDAVVRSGYRYSKQNLVMQFAKYLADFKPQNGKRRG